MKASQAMLTVMHKVCFRVGYETRRLCTSIPRTSAPAENQLLKQILQRIKINGPITVADYMKESLTNTEHVRNLSTRSSSQAYNQTHQDL